MPHCRYREGVAAGLPQPDPNVVTQLGSNPCKRTGPNQLAKGRRSLPTFSCVAQQS
ncbi:hypothetical protein BN2475_280069 [Paraburkholderia ribeironis]|uniref:Uncharacterized protein n=1 Tax=Paraburkholderia ribeironis TaxID=1247936 RepID=A0A1N7S1F8_9BURK|nr:hypothetical protein BN2475_280069 [Paraburkholderia ribeironis]